MCAENENCAVNFGNIQCGKVSTGLIHLRNESKVATLFQVYVTQIIVLLTKLMFLTASYW